MQNFFISNNFCKVTVINWSIQHKLEGYFGFNQTIFWYSDHQGNLRDPINYGLSDRALTDYLTEYRPYDLLYPTKNVELFRKKKAIRLADLSLTDQYDHSPFFQSFWKEYGYHDEMVVTLVHQGEFVGAIGMAQKEEQNKFTTNDRNTLHLYCLCTRCTLFFRFCILLVIDLHITSLYFHQKRN